MQAQASLLRERARTRVGVGVGSVLAAVSLLFACEARSPVPSGAQPADAPAAEASPAPSPTLGEDGLYELAGLRYREYVSGNAERESELPMIVLIHGLGDNPEDFEGIVRGFDTPARFIIPRGFDSHGPGWSWFSFRATDSAVEETAKAIAEAADIIAPAIAAISAARPTLGKPAVSGFSQGGMLSFALAIRHGEQFSAAYPMGGWLPEPLWPQADAKPATLPPIIAFHGELDERVPYLPTRRAVTQLEKLGYTVELRTYAGLGHSINRELHTDLMATFRARIAQQKGG